MICFQVGSVHPSPPVDKALFPVTQREVGVKHAVASLGIGAAKLFKDAGHGHSPVTIYLPLDLWQPAIGMGHLVA